MKNKKAGKIISRTITGILIVIAILIFVLVLKSSNGDVPDLFGYRCFVIVSDSMEPEILEDAVVIVKENENGDYEVDDIISFKSFDIDIFGDTNTHRIVEKYYDENGKPCYKTKGDNCEEADENLVYASEVYGKVVKIFNGGNFVGTLVEFLMLPEGFFILVLLPILIIAFITIKDIIKSFKEL